MFISTAYSPSQMESRDSSVPYLAYTLGSVPRASRIMMGVYGLFSFIVGYARFRNVLLCSHVNNVLFN